jgi:hypothetical protein
VEYWLVSVLDRQEARDEHLSDVDFTKPSRIMRMVSDFLQAVFADKSGIRSSITILPISRIRGTHYRARYDSGSSGRLNQVRDA